MRQTTAVVWFRRDLRLHDHPALTSAIEGHDRVVPLFVLDPRLLDGRFASPARTWFMLESLRELGTSLAALGAPLLIRTGDPAAEVAAVCARTGARDVYVSRDYAPYGRDRDARVAERLAAAGLAFRPRPGVLIHEPESLATGEGRPFGVYSPFRRAWEKLDRRAVLPAPASLPGHDLEAAPVPALREVGLGDDGTMAVSSLPTPGEAAARRRLDRWLERGVDDYAESRDRLDQDGTSRVSADLHFGLLSPNEIVERASGPGDGRRVFINEIAWREFYAHVLFHRPSVRTHAFRPEFDAIAWSSAAAAEAWRTGTTGFPIVDAAMRQLAATGWMHNRARMIVATFLTKDLLVDWRVGESHFMRSLVDGDVASNNGGWQWSASTGTDPQPYFRIFNPVAQGRRHDPDGAYIRRWIPELAAIPTRWIHAPWEMPDEAVALSGVRIGVDYPARIVDHAEARLRALDVFRDARSGAEPRVP
jgi:deoxyribodipyrimidine photo-lyase